MRCAGQLHEDGQAGITVGVAPPLAGLRPIFWRFSQGCATLALGYSRGVPPGRMISQFIANITSNASHVAQDDSYLLNELVTQAFEPCSRIEHGGLFHFCARSGNAQTLADSSPGA